MNEFKLTIETPDIADAIRALAAAIQSCSAIAAEPATTTKSVTKAPAATQAPVQAPAAPTTPALAVVQTPVVTPVVPSNPTLTLDVLSNAGASLLEKGMMPQLMALLGEYDVQAITQLKPDQYPAFAAELRAMGALI